MCAPPGAAPIESLVSECQRFPIPIPIPIAIPITRANTHILLHRDREWEGEDF